MPRTYVRPSPTEVSVPRMSRRAFLLSAAVAASAGPLGSAARAATRTPWPP